MSALKSTLRFDFKNKSLHTKMKYKQVWCVYLLLVKQMLITGEMTATSDFLGKQLSIPLEDIRMVTTSGRNYGTCKVLPIRGPEMLLKLDGITKSL